MKRPRREVKERKWKEHRGRDSEERIEEKKRVKQGSKSGSRGKKKLYLWERET